MPARSATDWGPDAAYSFAKGETVTASLGYKARLRRPLDFLVVADHAESLGLAPLLNARDSIALADPVGKRLIDLIASGDVQEAYRLIASERNAGRPVLHSEAIRKPMWQRIIDAADRHNDPGKFTAFIGYEYTSAPNRNNLHRVVMFRDGADKAGKILPFRPSRMMIRKSYGNSWPLTNVTWLARCWRSPIMAICRTA